ncbi:MAG: hypothetical protein M0P71_06735 [Melioribacteraceae bacterium]|nr:hypothetical protein [Melioribacteraceae bacterium]
MIDFHPFITHFPIVLFFVYTVFEIIAKYKPEYDEASFGLLIAGIIFALLSVLTGNLAHQIYQENTISGGKGVSELIELHENLATYTLFYYLGVLVIKFYFFIKKKTEKKYRLLIIILSILGLILVVYTGLYGGILVFENGVGVSLIK